MEKGRDDFVIAIRSAFLKKGTQQTFSIFSLILVSVQFSIIGLMIAIKINPHAENYINQQGPKNLDSFCLNCLLVGLGIYFLFSKKYLER